jgi:hypothetical protein
MAGEDLKKQIKEDKQAQSSAVLSRDELIAGQTLMNLATPEPYLMRQQAVNQARAGQYPKKDCMHPTSAITWNHDHVSERDREGRPLNWFECEKCHSILFLVDPHGRMAMEG